MRPRDAHRPPYLGREGRPTRPKTPRIHRPRFHHQGALALLAALLLSAVILADDGPMVRKDIARTPEQESDHAQLSMMQFWVPASKADGSLTTLEYAADRDDDNQPDEVLFTRDHAKPLIATYWDEEPLGAHLYDILTGEEVGPAIRRDVWGAASFDDGETWKQRNLSESATESSFRLMNGIVYPGDVTEIAHAVAGDRILVAWTSKYCSQGSPRYSLKDELDEDGDGNVEEPLYVDLFGVAGNQGSIDYTTWMHHGTYPFAHIGEIPFSCVWTARGTVEHMPPGDGSDVEGDVWSVRWRKAERLTSGRRDAYKLAIDGVEGAGFAVAWQEDPEGLRPGYGEGPGVGWSGATVNHKTDLWYTSIAWDDFALVEDPDNPGVPAPDPDLLDTNRPKVFETMAMPVRLTDNQKCELIDGKPKTNAEGEITMPWCYDLDVGDGTPAGRGIPDGIGDLCPLSYDEASGYTVADPDRVIPWTNSQGATMDICLTDDGRLLNGQIGSSRARMMLEGYTRPDGTKSAWAVVMAEESKGLGAGPDPEAEALDIGKDAMYHTFDMFRPDLVAAGHMLNMPETADEDLAAEYGIPIGDFLPLIPSDLSVALAGGDVESAVPDQYDTPISRRGSFMLQPTVRMVEEGYRPGMTTALLLYKAGADRQGGPADIFARRTVLPADFDPAVDNPYAVENLVCDELDTSLSDGDRPTYPRTSYPYGLCIRGATNLSSTTPTELEPLGNDDQDPSHGILDRVVRWTQDPEDLTDEHWTNKYDVAKGHRGFLDGDFVMVMYGWSANWLATSKGHEPYNLLLRRSFDGGLTWTTTPAAFGGSGTTYDQIHGVGERVWTETRVLGPGDFEPARDVSQLTSNKETTLDPRYSPTNLGTQSDVTRILLEDGSYQQLTTADPLYELRDPSKFFVVYETGDATVVLSGGEADPWDLFASRATTWGDHWATVDVFAQGTGEWEERWDWVENRDETMSGESNILGSPDGQFAWVVWNQWIQHETDTNGDDCADVTEADPMFRRLWWDDESVDLVALAGHYEAPDGSAVELQGNAVYAGDMEDLSFEWDLDADGEFETSGHSVEILANGVRQGVALHVCDGEGHCDTDQGWINPRDHTPRIWDVRVTENPVALGQLASLSARFTNPGGGDEPAPTISWGDGSSSQGSTVEATGDGTSARIVGEHVWTDPDLHSVKVALADLDGHVGWSVLRWAVVFDPATAVDATGLTYLDPASGDPVALQFQGSYASRDAVAPAGWLSLTLDGQLFETGHFDWVVVDHEGLTFVRGAGSFLGGEELQFLVSATIGSPDRVRVRLWRANGLADEVVYDTQPGDPLDADPATPLTSGSVDVLGGFDPRIFADGFETGDTSAW